LKQKTWNKISLNYTWLLHDKNSRLDDAFAGIFQLEVSPVEGQQLQQKDKKRRKSKNKKNKNKHAKPKDKGYFLAQKISQNFPL